MRLTLKQGDSIVNEFQFSRGPVYVGRHTNSQIFLSHPAVSRQHAVVFQTQDGKWMVEDLDSTNKTYLNDKEIHKAEIKSGDIMRILDFTVQIDIEEGVLPQKRIDLEDTLTKTAYDLQAAAAISTAGSIDKLLLMLLDITLKQFAANRVWCALRTRASGPMTAHAGKQAGGQAVAIGEIELREKVTEAVEKGQNLVLPRLPAQAGEGKILSAMIATVRRPTGCYGVMYVDNVVGQQAFALGELDYLILLASHAATVISNL